MNGYKANCYLWTATTYTDDASQAYTGTGL